MRASSGTHPQALERVNLRRHQEHSRRKKLERRSIRELRSHDAQLFSAKLDQNRTAAQVRAQANPEFVKALERFSTQDKTRAIEQLSACKPIHPEGASSASTRASKVDFKDYSQLDIAGLVQQYSGRDDYDTMYRKFERKFLLR